MEPNNAYAEFAGYQHGVNHDPVPLELQTYDNPEAIEAGDVNNEEITAINDGQPSLTNITPPTSFSEYMNSVFTNIGDIPDAAVRGALRGIGETAYAANLVDEDQINNWRKFLDTSSEIAVQEGVNKTSNALIEGVAQLAPAAVPVFKTMRLLGAGRAAATLIAETISGAASFNPDDPNLGNLAIELFEPNPNGQLSQALKLLATNPNDPDIYNRARNGIQDGSIGLFFEGVFKSPEILRMMISRVKEGKSPLPMGMSIEDVSTPVRDTPYRSRLLDAIEAMPQDKMNAEQFQGYLNKVQGGVSKDEIEFSGIAERLKQGGTVTKDELEQIYYRSQFGIEDITKTDNETFGAENTVLRFNEPEPVPDPEYVSSVADELMYEVETDGVDSFPFQEITDKLKEMYPSKYPSDSGDWYGRLVNHFQSRGNTVNELDPALRDDFKEAANAVSQDYYDNMPYQRVYDPDNDIEIFGNDDFGWTVKVQGEDVTDYRPGRMTPRQPAVFSNLEEAKIRATQEAYDSGLLISPEYDEGTVFGEWTLKGGRDYEEKLLVLPESTDRSKNYTGGHFQENNVVAHIRSTTRKIGNKIAHFIEEFQSDWWLAGRQNGFIKPIPPEVQSKLDRFDELQLGAARALKNFNMPRIGDQQGSDTPKQTGEWQQLFDELSPWLKMRKYGVPKMPFTNTWPDLAFRRAVYDAAKRDTDVIAWTGGKTQADRYNLSKHVKSVYYKDGTLYADDLNGKTVIAEDVEPDGIDEYIGKDLGDKIREQLDLRGGEAVIEGLDLEIGGAGKKKLYDKMFPKIANKFAKKYGEKAELVDMETPDGVVKVWQLKLTPEMKKDILKGGVALSALPMAAMPKEKEK